MHYSSTAEELSTLKRTLEQLPIKTVLIALAMLVISILIVKLVLAIVDKALKKTKLDVSQYRFIKAILRVLLYFCALMIIASYLGIDVTSLAGAAAGRHRRPPRPHPRRPPQTGGRGTAEQGGQQPHLLPAPHGKRRVG